MANTAPAPRNHLHVVVGARIGIPVQYCKVRKGTVFPSIFQSSEAIDCPQCLQAVLGELKFPHMK